MHSVRLEPTTLTSLGTMLTYYYYYYFYIGNAGVLYAV